jgi:hypothetical protein
MTEQTPEQQRPEDIPTAAAPPAESPAGAPQPPPATAPSQPPAEPPDGGHAGGYGPPAPYGPPPQYADPFVPVSRAPRVPWVNPVRRTHVVVAAVAGALIFGGAGVAVGYAIAPDGHHGATFRNGPVIGPDGEQLPFGPGYGYRHNRQAPRPSTAPSSGTNPSAGPTS